MLFYECESNGLLYFHWANFREYVSQYNSIYPHNKNHRRVLLYLRGPADSMLALNEFIPPGITNPSDWKTYSNDWSVIFEPFHAHFHDPVPSWILFLEKGHKKPTWGEPIELFSEGLSLYDDDCKRMARFRGMFYIVDYFNDQGFGEADSLQVCQKRIRTIDDDWGL